MTFNDVFNATAAFVGNVITSGEIAGTMLKKQSSALIIYDYHDEKDIGRIDICKMFANGNFKPIYSIENNAGIVTVRYSEAGNIDYSRDGIAFRVYSDAEVHDDIAKYIREFTELNLDMVNPFTALKNSFRNGVEELVQMMIDTRNVKTFKDFKEWASNAKRDEFGYHFLADEEDNEHKIALHIYNGVTQVNVCAKVGDMYNPCTAIIFNDDMVTVVSVNENGVTNYDEASTYKIDEELPAFVKIMVAAFIQASEDTPKED